MLAQCFMRGVEIGMTVLGAVLVAGGGVLVVLFVLEILAIILKRGDED